MTRLLGVPGPDAVRKALIVAVAELHIKAGWAGFDAGLCDRAMFHYARTVELATEEHGQPDEGLKMLQYGGSRHGTPPRMTSARWWSGKPDGRPCWR